MTSLDTHSPQPLRVVIDTDCANEIDDQFALAWALLAPDKLQVEATVAAPFSFRHHLAPLRAGTDPFFQAWAARLAAQGRTIDELDRHLVDPATGMELSLQEIRRIHQLCRADPPAYAGATRYMTAPDDVVWSAGAEAIVDLAKTGTQPLYVAAMGCVTNVAAALIRAPEIADTITVLWTAGFPTLQPHPQHSALNLVQDPHATRVLFNCGVPLVYLPGYHIGAQLRISRPDMQCHVRGHGPLGDYLWSLYDNNPIHRMRAMTDTERRSWVIWDMIDIAWLINRDWVPTFTTPSPVLTPDLRWQAAAGRHMIQEAYDINRDDIFRDFYDRLDAFASR
ncbi:MAG: nucleoside hydrolase [Rhodobacterales bacterium]